MTINTITSSVLLLLACFTASGLYAQRCSCVTGPPDYLCPTAPLLQVYLKHEKFCTRYYKCTDGRAIEFQCPYGTYFDVQNATCTSDFTLCYRVDPCIQFIDICRCCARQFDNTGLTPPNFYVCLNDGFAEAQTCPVALDPCTNTTIQLEFINQKCEVPPATTTILLTTTLPTTTTTLPTTTTTLLTTTTTLPTTTTTLLTTTTTEITTTTTLAP